MEPIDLRSDTVSRPTPEMRNAIAAAPVGDDVYGEDPTVNRLQEIAAQRTGKESALFVPSGSMANQLAIRIQANPGEVVLGGNRNHVLRYEAGSAAALAGVQIRTLGESGLFDEDDIHEAATPGDVHTPASTLCIFENTHNAGGGLAWPETQLARATAAARQHGMSLHLDGARIFNAAVATGQSPESIASHFDSVSFCLSKGLGAPVGSLLCGRSEFIERARLERKRLGGGMRQAGILAAAGIYALEHHVDRLVEDHANARRLADGLRENGFDVAAHPETNMVLIQTPDPEVFLEAAAEKGVLMGPIGSGRVRAVTHLDVDSSDIDQAIECLAPLGKR